ncbi:MAG: type II toxin-antitoxin system HicA family toxin [Candidatus Kapabacteria bacterium]|jgi:predicted RNA binding protein YcfA (HicA-like mRNA interferase family)|nr:type II toxin-antitoxin system HicA family toxin [Candidatus Kapabacteria bacterium]
MVIVKTLQKLGFFVVRQKGSHVVLRKPVVGGDHGCSVPLHENLAVGTLAGIIKQAKLTNEEFITAFFE